MTKKTKGPRVLITLECTNCTKELNKRKAGISRYSSTKNRRTTPERIELSKYCCFCNKHTIHKEIK